VRGRLSTQTDQNAPGRRDGKHRIVLRSWVKSDTIASSMEEKERRETEGHCVQTDHMRARRSLEWRISKRSSSREREKVEIPQLISAEKPDRGRQSSGKKISGKKERKVLKAERLSAQERRIRENRKKKWTSVSETGQ